MFTIGRSHYNVVSNIPTVPMCVSNMRDLGATTENASLID